MSGFDRKPNRFESNWFDESHFYASKFISLDSVFRVIRGRDHQVQRKRHVFWNVLVCTLMKSRPQIIVLDRCAQMTVISLNVYFIVLRIGIKSNACNPIYLKKKHVTKISIITKAR